MNTAHDDVWGFDFQHVNPSTDTVDVIYWKDEHRNMAVEHDCDWATSGDRHVSVGVMNP